MELLRFNVDVSFEEGSLAAVVGSSSTCGLNMNEESHGSGSVLDEDTKHEEGEEEPPRKDCKFPSFNSFLKADNEVELDPPPLRSLLLRCTFSLVKENK